MSILTQAWKSISSLKNTKKPSHTSTMFTKEYYIYKSLKLYKTYVVTAKISLLSPSVILPIHAKTPRSDTFQRKSSRKNTTNLFSLQQHPKGTCTQYLAGTVSIIFQVTNLASSSSSVSLNSIKHSEAGIQI